MIRLKEQSNDQNELISGRLVQVGEEAYGEGGYDMFTGVGKVSNLKSPYID